MKGENAYSFEVQHELSVGTPTDMVFYIMCSFEESP